MYAWDLNSQVEGKKKYHSNTRHAKRQRQVRETQARKNIASQSWLSSWQLHRISIIACTDMPSGPEEAPLTHCAVPEPFSNLFWVLWSFLKRLDGFCPKQIGILSTLPFPTRWFLFLMDTMDNAPSCALVSYKRRAQDLDLDLP